MRSVVAPGYTLPATQSPARYMEHRCSPRTECDLPATVKPRTGHRKSCIIRDVSHDGMLLDTGETWFRVGEVVLVGLACDAVPHEEYWLRALVVHSRAGYAGVWLDEKDDQTHSLMLQLCGH